MNIYIDSDKLNKICIDWYATEDGSVEQWVTDFICEQGKIKNKSFLLIWNN
jgi:hypothetical protein